MTEPHDQRIVGLYEQHAAKWDTERSQHLAERDWLGRFAALIPPGGSILDLGCGTGEPVARHLIECGYPVTGVDSSRAMIALARARIPAGDWLVADMRGLALGRRFDGLIAWDSFFHLNRDDQRRMFPVFAEHAMPGTALMFTSGPSDGEALGCFAGEPLYHASLDPAEYRACLAESGFEVVAHAVEDPTCGRHTIWLARRI